MAEVVAAEGVQEVITPAEEEASRRLAQIASDDAVDRMIADAQQAGVPLLDGPEALALHRSGCTMCASKP